MFPVLSPDALRIHACHNHVSLAPPKSNLAAVLEIDSFKGTKALVPLVSGPAFDLLFMKKELMTTV